MNRKLGTKYNPAIALLLAASLLTSCVMQRSTPTESATSSATSQDYERYDKGSIQLQKDFDRFTEDLFKKEVINSTIDLHFTLYDPAAYGITNPPVTFGNFSLDQMHRDTQEMKDLKTKLKEMDSTKLRQDQKLTYQILDTYLDTELAAEGMEHYFQPLTSTIGIQAQLPILLAEYVFNSRQDVEDYLGLLSQIDTYYSQIMEFEKAKSEAGLFMSDTSIDHVIESCSGYLLPPEHSFLTETFATRLAGLKDLSETDIADYIARNEKALQEHFIPAYQLLVDGLTALKGTGKNEIGLYGFPKGKEYYEYLVDSSTGTSYPTIAKLKKAIETQMDKDLASMSIIIKGNPAIYDQLDTYAFRYTDPQEILDQLQQQILTDFPVLPACNYDIKYVPKALENTLSPAFYLTPPLDKYQDNVIYINGGERFADSDLYTTLAHEGYPGHLYQNVYFSSVNTCNLRELLSFPSYSEGWATYVEHYSYTLDNGLDPQLGKVLALNSSATLALHALLDIDINYYGWDKQKVADYLGEYYNIEGTDIVDDMFYSLVENPTNYLEYYVGYMELTNMKDMATKKLGDNFNLKEFNTYLLDMGPAPFSIIRPHFNTWLSSKE